MNKNRQRRNKFYYEKLRHEKLIQEKLSQEKFKNALKALSMLEIKSNKRVRRICN